MNLSDPVVYLSFLVFLPAVAALVLAFFPRFTDDAIKLITLAVTITAVHPVARLFPRRRWHRFRSR